MRFFKYSFFITILLILSAPCTYSSIRYVAEGISSTDQSVILLGTTSEESEAVESIAQTVYLCLLAKQQTPPLFLMEWDEHSSQVLFVRDAPLLRKEALPHYVYAFPNLPELIQAHLRAPLASTRLPSISEVKAFSAEMPNRLPLPKPIYINPTIAFQDCSTETFFPTKYLISIDDRPTVFHQVDMLLQAMRHQPGLTPAALTAIMKLERKCSDEKSLKEISLEDLINDIQEAHDTFEHRVSRSAFLPPELKAKFIARLQGQNRAIEEFKALVEENLLVEINENHKDIRRHLTLKSSVLDFLQEWWLMLRDNIGVITPSQREAIIEQFEEFHTTLECAARAQTYLPLALEVFYYHINLHTPDLIILAPVTTVRCLHAFLEKNEYIFEQKADKATLKKPSACTTYLANLVETISAARAPLK